MYPVLIDISTDIFLLISHPFPIINFPFRMPTKEWKKLLLKWTAQHNWKSSISQCTLCFCW